MLGALRVWLLYNSFWKQAQQQVGNGLSVSLWNECKYGGMHNLEPSRLPIEGHMNNNCVYYFASVGWEDFRTVWMDDLVLDYIVWWDGALLWTLMPGMAEMIWSVLWVVGEVGDWVAGMVWVQGEGKIPICINFSDLFEGGQVKESKVSVGGGRDWLQLVLFLKRSNLEDNSLSCSI